MDTPGYTNIA